MMSTRPAASRSRTSFVSCLRPEAADHVDHDRKASKPVAQCFQMLECQNGRRCEKRDLLRIKNGLEGSAHRHLGLAVPDVAAQQAIHRRGRLHVSLHVRDSCRLIRSWFVRKRSFEFLLPMRVRREGVSGHCLSLRVQLEEFLGHVAHRLLDARLCLFPGRPAQTIERRS